MANRVARPTLTATGEGWEYQLERDGIFSDWFAWPYTFTTDPEDGGELRANVTYWLYCRNLDLPGIDLQAASFKFTEDDRIVTVDPAGNDSDADNAAGLGLADIDKLITDALKQVTLESARQNGPELKGEVKVDSGSIRFQADSGNYGVAWDYVLEGGTVKTVTLSLSKTGEILVDGVPFSPNLDQVANRGNITGRPIRADGGFGRFDFTRFQGTPDGLAAVVDLGPVGKWIEKMYPPEIRAYLGVLATVLTNPQNGQRLGLRLTGGAPELVNLPADTWNDVVSRGNTTVFPVEALGYGRPGVTATPTANMFAHWFPIGNKVFIEGITAAAAALQLLGLMPGEQLADKVRPFLGGSSSYPVRVVTAIRCEEVEEPYEFDSKWVPVTNSLHNQVWPHPFADPANLTFDVYNPDGSPAYGVGAILESKQFRVQLPAAVDDQGNPITFTGGYRITKNL